MVSFGVVEEYRDFLRTNIVMGNVTGLTNRPVVILTDEQISSDNNPGVTGDPASGILRLGLLGGGYAKYVEIERMTDFSDELFSFNGTYELAGQTAKTKFQSMLEEIKNVCRVANAARNTRAYRYKLNIPRIHSYWPNGLADLEYILIRELVEI